MYKSLALATVFGACCINSLAYAEPVYIYRLALTTTGEFGEQFTSISQQSQFLDELVEQVNTITVRDLGIRFVVMDNNDQLLHADPLTDPFTQDVDRSQLATEGDVYIQSTVDPAKYEIGHTIGFDLNGGIAGTAFPCSTNNKSYGVSDVSVNSFDGNVSATIGSVNLLLHELGHQLGASHTFNSVVGACGLMRQPETAVEPGAGTTLMSYAENSCGEDNFGEVEQHFHAASIAEINDFRNRIDSSCLMVDSATGNLPSVDAGPDVVVPAGTPLLLQGSISGAENAIDVVSNWEQIDPGQGALLSANDNGLNPLFRSVAPGLASHRFLPRSTDLNSNTVRPEETLPTVDRVMHFSLTARDTELGSARDERTIQVDDNAGPFVVTLPQDGVQSNGIIAVRWNVAGTDQNPVGAEFVDIFLLLSDEGLYDFQRPLLLRTPNDGAEFIQLPEFGNSQAKILVKGSDNIFFNVSPGYFSMNGGGDEICPAADIVEHYASNWSTGSLSQWSTSVGVGSRNWQIDSRNALTGSFHVSISNAATQASQSSSQALVENLIDARLTTNNPITIPPNAVLQIQHAQSRIDRYSAGLLEWSTDNGVVWNSIESTAPTMNGGYDNGVSVVGTSSATTADIERAYGKPAFNQLGAETLATDAQYQSTRFDLSSIAGSSVLLRIRFLSTGYGDLRFTGDEYGWDVDSVRVISCISTSRLTIPNGQWVQMGALATEPAQSIAQLFSGILDASTYGTDWIVFEYVQSQTPNAYRAASIEDFMVSGRGYWVQQFSGEDVVFEQKGRAPASVNTANADCPEGSPCVVSPFPVSEASDTYWTMVANPYGIPLSLDQLFIGVELDGNREIVTFNNQGSSFTHSAGLFAYNPDALESESPYTTLATNSVLPPMSAGWLGVALNASTDSIPRVFTGFTQD